jgi:hypothetical protein
MEELIMLIKESQLQSRLDPMSMLAEATFLSEEESRVQPVTIPVREMSRLGEGVTMVRFADVERLAEDSQVSYMDAVAAIAEASEVDVDKMTIAVDEADLIVDPSLLDEMTNIVVAPISENSLAYRYVSECIDAWANMDDTAEVDAMLEAALVEDSDLEAFCEGLASDYRDGADKKFIDQENEDVRKPNTLAGKAGQVAAGVANAVSKNKGTVAAAGGLATALAVGAAALKKANGKPKSWIGQKIASLRNIYAKWMKRAQNSDASVAGRIKAAAGKLMAIIDQLMAKLQKAAG